MRSRLPFVLVVLAALALGAVAGLLYRGSVGPPAPPEPSDRSPTITASALDSLQADLRRIRARFERLPPPTGDEENALRSGRTPAYSVHRERGETLGVPRITSEAQLDALVEDGRLVPLVDTEHYTVRTLEHSAPFITPDLRALLAEIGERFHAGLAEHGLPPYRFVISSALRTPTLQEDLRSSNLNAAVNASSHEYGVSVDIVTWRYRFEPDRLDSSIEALRAEVMAAYGYRYWDHLFGLMTSILTDLQREGAAVVLLEDRQPVFHTTVARRFR